MGYGLGGFRRTHAVLVTSVIHYCRSNRILSLPTPPGQLSTGAGLVHCGYGYWSLGGISNSELNFFFTMTEYFWLSWSFGTAGFVLGISGATLAIIHVRRDLDKLDDDPERTREAFLDKLKRDKLQRDKQKLAAKNKNYDDEDDDDERYARPSEKETWRINI